MNLTIDFGNSLVKYGIFDNEKLVIKSQINTSNLDSFLISIEDYEINKCIISSVTNIPDKFLEDLKFKFDSVLILSSKSKIPFEINYNPKESLGIDRIALISGAISTFPNQEILIIDAGTCITYDFVDSNKHYYGGAISPGLSTRFKSLNNFTERLPLIDNSKFNDIFDKNIDFLGLNTQDSIILGVYKSIIFEIDGYINLIKLKYPNIKVVLTGGDTKYFDGKVKNTIFADENFLLKGLNYLIHYND